MSSGIGDDMYSPTNINEEQETISKKKESLPEGPWLYECDRYSENYGPLVILLRRNPKLLTWCAYVGITEDFNGMYNVKEDMLRDMLDVHGGVTYAGKCNGVLSEAPEENNLFWIGFDTAHSNDYIPGLDIDIQHSSATYKDYEYVLDEARYLADQVLKYKRRNGLRLICS